MRLLFLIVYTMQLVGAMHTETNELPSSNHSVNVTYQVRKTISLNCSTQTRNNISVIWKKKGISIPIAVNGVLLVHADRYTLSESTDKSISTLTVMDATVKDAGVYVCSVLQAKTVLNTTTFIVTRAGKYYTDISLQTAYVSAMMGRKVNLPCEVRHRHKNKVIWLDPRGDPVTYGMKSLRSRFNIDSKGQKINWTLQIRSVKKQDFGHYTCMVDTKPALWEVVVLNEIVDWKAKGTTKPFIFTSPVTTSVPEILLNHTQAELHHTTESLDDHTEPGEPRTGAISSRQELSDYWKNVVLVLAATSIIVIVIVVASVYLLNRVHKMTRKIIQQEIQLDHVRNRRRERRLTSETRAFISKQDELEDQMEINPNSGSANTNPYCDPWSSQSNIIKAMHTAYSRRKASESDNGAVTRNDMSHDTDRSCDMDSQIVTGVNQGCDCQDETDFNTSQGSETRSDVKVHV